VLRALDDSGHVTLAFGAHAHQQQVASLEGAGEVGDGRLVAAMSAPDVGQQALADVCWDRFPALAGGFGEDRQGFDCRQRYPGLLFDKKQVCRLAGTAENESRRGNPRNLCRAAQRVSLLGRHPQRDANAVGASLAFLLHRNPLALILIQAITI
jgi:hypothetical protein